MANTTSQSTERMQYDLVLVGGSPSNLALAHRLLARHTDASKPISIAILEKSREFGGHICSGAVVKPRILKELFPNWEEDKFPIEAVCDESHFSVMGEQSIWHAPNALLPAGLKKQGYWVLTLSMVVAWMADQLKKKAAESEHITVDLFPGFAAHEILYDGDRVSGVSVVENKDEHPEAADNQIFGKLVCFGDKGFLSEDLVKKYSLRPNPQIWSVGVKEVWQLPKPGKDATDEEKATFASYDGKVWHTMGYPLTDGSFGGGFIYGMKNNRLTIGLIASLDSPNPNLNPQQLLQAYKKHPFVANMLKDATLFKYGAALLPEGGYYSLPTQFGIDGALLMGDALGVLDVSNLNGVSNSMECGKIAADIITELLANGKDFTIANLKPYQTRVMGSAVGDSLKQGRYFRDAFQSNPKLLKDYLPEVMEGVDKGNPWGAVTKMGTKATLSGEAFTAGAKILGIMDFGKVKYAKDHEHIVPDYTDTLPSGAADENTPKDLKAILYSREDAVFYAGTKYHHDVNHIDEFNAETCVACISKYDALNKETPCVSDCTAEVHRIDIQEQVRVHGMSLENCIQCRTCQMVCPQENLKVRPAEQGSGPDYLGL